MYQVRKENSTNVAEMLLHSFETNSLGEKLEWPETGAGLLLEKGERNGIAVVKKILVSGAAEDDGRIQLGDQLTHVDGKAVAAMALEQVIPGV